MNGTLQSPTSSDAGSALAVPPAGAKKKVIRVVKKTRSSAARDGAGDERSLAMNGGARQPGVDGSAAPSASAARRRLVGCSPCLW